MKQIITTLSFRGGTGKSTLVSNLATILAENGNRVIIIDTDIQSPGMNAVFGLDKGSVSDTLSDYLRGKIRIEDAVYDVSDVVGLKRGKLFLVPGSMHYEALATNLTKKKQHNLIRKGVETIINSFEPDYIIIDSHPGINEEILLTASFSDIVFNILRPDNQDYQGAEVTNTLLKKLETNTHLLLNKVHKKVTVEDLRKKLQQSFDLPIAGVLPFSEEVLYSQSSFIFSHKYPHHPFSQEIQRISVELFDERPHESLNKLHYLLVLIKKQPSTEDELFTASNLSKRSFTNGLGELQRDKFIKKSNHTLFITRKGMKFLHNYSTVSNFVDKFRL